MLVKKTMSVLIGVAVFAITMFSCAGCISITHGPQKIIRTTTGKVIKKDNTLFPIQSFVMTRQSFQISTVVCDEEQNCLQHVLGTSNSVASGVIIKTETDNSYVLTAGHVCVPPPPTTSIPGEVKVQYKIDLVTGFGRKAEGVIVAIDLENDLCLLSVESYLGPGLEIQESETKLHTKVYNMASPRGLGAPIAVPVFDGYYVGKVLNKTLFTIPASPGSSGSPVMNDKNQIITIVSAAAIQFDEFAICPTTEEVRKFILSNLPIKKEKSTVEKLTDKLQSK